MTIKNPIKVLVCEKSIRELDRAIDVLSKLKVYCDIVKVEEINKEINENSEQFFDIHVMGAFKELHCKNGIVNMANMGQFVKDLLENCDRIKFPPDFFEDEKPDYVYDKNRCPYEDEDEDECEGNCDCCDEQYVPKISKDELEMIKKVAEIVHRLGR